MSVEYGKVISLILQEHFGPVVEKIGTYLFQNGTNPLLYIKNNVQLPLSKVKEALRILIKYQLVTFTPNRNNNIANYTINRERVFLMLRYPKYVSLIKKRYGDECEIIVEELLLKGYLTATEIINKVVNKLKKDHDKDVPPTKVREHLHALINSQYLGRLPEPFDDSPVPNMVNLRQEKLFAIPDAKEEISVYWEVNFDRFHQDFRDALIVAGFAKKFDENSGEFVRILLQQMYGRNEAWVDCSNPIPVFEIRDLVRKSGQYPHLLAFFDQYVDVIVQDCSNLIRKSGDAGGGSIQIYLKETFINFAWETLEQLVLEKFDTKAARIFRLIKMKGYMEQDQIQQLAMIPTKEAKRLCYKLLEENFLQIQELRKTAGGPNKCFHLFYINLTHTVHVMLEFCYKTLFNIMTKKNLEKSDNKRLIDKKQRVDTIIMGMKAQGADSEQLADIEDMITPPENEILSKIERHMKRLNVAELEVDDTIFIFEMYLRYHKL